MKSVKDSLIKKFKEISPGLPLIEEGSVLKKIERLFQTSVKAKANHLKGSNLKRFQEKLDLLFDIILCHCQFLICGEVRGVQSLIPLASMSIAPVLWPTGFQRKM